MEAPAPREAILPWRRIARLSLLPALVATAICWVGWTVEPVLSVAISVLLAIVGGASAMLWSIWLVVRRRRLDESFWRKESGRVAVLVLTLVLLVPANLLVAWSALVWGWHYAVDFYPGLALAWGGWWAAGAMLGEADGRRRDPGSDMLGADLPPAGSGEKEAP